MRREEAEAKFRAYLQAHDMFFTKERRTILEAVFAAEDHFSADDMVFTMQQQGLKVSRATLYRALSHMHEAGILEQADFGHGHTHYEPPRKGRPHEHIACEKCGKVVEIPIPELQALLEKAASKAGYTQWRHQLRLTGLCPACQ